MNRYDTLMVLSVPDLPRTHGDEPEDYCLFGLLVASAPCARDTRDLVSGKMNCQIKEKYYGEQTDLFLSVFF